MQGQLHELWQFGHEARSRPGMVAARGARRLQGLGFHMIAEGDDGDVLCFGLAPGAAHHRVPSGRRGQVNQHQIGPGVNRRLKRRGITDDYRSCARLAHHICNPH